MLLYTTVDMIEKVKVQLEKLIEVDAVTYHEGNQVYQELSERIIDAD